MPRQMSVAMLREKNKLESNIPWVYLFQLDIGGAPTPYRLAAYNEDIVYNGFTWNRYPLEVDVLESPTHAALAQIRVTVGNVDQQLQALLETYWVTVASPSWGVQIFEIIATDPTQTPVGTAERFSVQQATTDLLSATFDLTAEGLTLSSTVPKRRYTASSGYPFIPRRN